MSETTGGALSIGCHRCEFSGYGKKGTKARRLIEAAMTRDQDDSAPAPPPVEKKPPGKASKAPAAPPPPAAPTAPSKGFSLEDLN